MTKFLYFDIFDGRSYYQWTQLSRANWWSKVNPSKQPLWDPAKQILFYTESVKIKDLICEHAAILIEQRSQDPRAFTLGSVLFYAITKACLTPVLKSFYENGHTKIQGEVPDFAGRPGVFLDGA